MKAIQRPSNVMAVDETFKKAPKAKVAGTGSTAALLKKDDSLPSDEKTEKTFKNWAFCLDHGREPEGVTKISHARRLARPAV